MTMTPLRSMPVLLMLLVCVFVTGCHKKTVLVMPQQPPPAAAPTPAPVAHEKPPKPQPSPTPEAVQNHNETARKNHTRPKPHRTSKKSAPRVARNNPMVINNGDVPTVAPAPSPELAKQMEATDQLLKNTEKAINGITRQLSQNEKAMLAQIQDFIKQSRAATDNNDFGRAHNLALKAHLLSDELTKNR